MFLTPLDVRATQPGQWMLLADLVWDGDEQIIVHAGFVTDLASIPPTFQGFIDINGRSRRPACLHDYLYQTGLLPRALADDIFLEALISEGIQPGVARRVFWQAVRNGGRRIWDKLRRKSA